jgi:hypothetical protein
LIYERAASTKRRQPISAHDWRPLPRTRTAELALIYV